MAKVKNGIFCLEGLWDNNLKKASSVKPILDLLKCTVGARYIYGNCATVEEFKNYLSKWVHKSYRDYPVLYIATHGEEGLAIIGSSKVPIEDIAEWLKGKCHNRIIIFGSCSTMAIHGAHLKTFLRDTGALAICGYRTEVDWIESTAFELILLSIMQENKIEGRGVEPIKKKADTWASNKSFKKLNFRMLTQKTVRSNIVYKAWQDCDDISRKDALGTCKNDCDYWHECPKRRKAMKNSIGL